MLYCGTFSKTVAPALRVGYLVAPWHVMQHVLPLKTDAGSGALEQMVLAEYLPGNFTGHVDGLNRMLKLKSDAMFEALGENFGATAEFSRPVGGIYIWVTMPDFVDTRDFGGCGGGRRCRHQSRSRLDGVRGRESPPHAALFRASQYREHPRGRREIGCHLLPGIRGATAQRKRRACLIKRERLADLGGPVLFVQQQATQKAIKRRHEMNGAKTRDFIEKRIRGQADQLIADIDYSAIDPDYDLETALSWLLGSHIESELYSIRNLRMIRRDGRASSTIAPTA